MPYYHDQIREMFEQVVEQTLAEVPPIIYDKVDNITIVVENSPPSDVRETNRCDCTNGECILGYYEGVPLNERGLGYIAVTPDRISIYISSHLSLNLSDEDLKAEIRHTVLHEVGHHLGISEGRLHELGWG